MDYTAENLKTYFGGLTRLQFNADAAEVSTYGIASYLAARFTLSPDQFASLNNLATQQTKPIFANALVACGHDYIADGYESVTYDFSGMTVTNTSTNGHTVIHFNVLVIYPFVVVSMWIEHKNA